MRLFDKMTKMVTENLGGTAKKFVIAALCVIIGGAAVCGVMLQTQIREAVTAYQTEEAQNALEELAQKDNNAVVAQTGGDHDHHAGQEQQTAGIAVNNGAAAPAQPDNAKIAEHDGEHFDNEIGQEGHDGHMAENDEAGGSQDHERHDEGFWHDSAFTEPSLGAKISIVVYGLVCCAFVAAYWLLTAAWLNGAAAAAGMNAVAWTLAGLAGNMAAVALFLALRFRKYKCSSCGRYQNKTEFCRFCGASMGGKCRKCGAEVDGNDIYCGHCGSFLAGGTDKA